MEPSPRSPDLIITSKQSSAGDKGVSLWRMPHQTEDEILDGDIVNFGDLLDLEEISRFPLRDSTVFVQNMKWHHTKDNVLVADSKEVTVFAVTDSAVKVSYRNSCITYNYVKY
jgi:hypothetical protein